MIISMGEKEFKKYVKKDRIKQPLTELCEALQREFQSIYGINQFQQDRLKTLIQTFQVKLDL